MSVCVICAREAEHGYLDADCFSRLSSMLRDIEDEAAILDAAPSMAMRTGSGGGSLASERSPARLEVMAFRDPQTRQWVPSPESRPELPAPKSVGPWCLLCDHETCTAWRAGRQRDQHDDEHDAGSAGLMSILGVLHGWGRVLREELWDRDVLPGESVTISGERDLLTGELRWLARQPFIDEMFAELRQLLESLKALNRTQDERPVGTCFLPAEFGVCAGRIWRREQRRVVNSTIGRRPVKVADGPAYCDRCHATWDGPELTRLALILEQQQAEAARPKTEDGRRMLTAQEMADRLGCSVNAVRIVVSRKRIPNVHGHYDPEWFADKDVA